MKACFHTSKLRILREISKKAGTLSDSGEWVDGAPAAAASHFSDTLAFSLKNYAVSSDGRVLGAALPGHGTAHMTTYGESAWRFWHYPIWNDTGIPGQSFGPGITYNNKDVCGWGALVARTSTDPDGKMTSDGLSGKQIAYNALDLPRKVSSGSTTSANYSYLADGTRTSAVGSDGSG